MMNISVTENQNRNTMDIDLKSSFEIAKLINDEDKKIADAVEKCLPEIAKAIDVISENFLDGGRLLYFGAGTSGRLGILDASECPPTFSVSPNMVQGIIAGGEKAMTTAVEGAEDSIELAMEDIIKLDLNEYDTVVALSASGNPKYVIEILKQAKMNNCKTIGISANEKALIKEFSDIFICVNTGAEVITGSTRMKAGTAEKMILNMLSTGSMIKIGKTYQNFMIDLKPTNDKLRDRAVKIVSQIADKGFQECFEMLEQNDYNVKESILMLKYNMYKEDAKFYLQQHNGILRRVFEELDRENS